MSYTLLRVDAEGVALWEYHLRRLALAPAGPAHAALLAFARAAAPGVFALSVDGGGALRVEPRTGSRLHEGMPMRFAPSPVAGGRGARPKPPPGGPYDDVRLPGVATLLTSPDGRELYEACAAALVAWDGAALVCVPPDRPRVWSTAEQAIREHLAPRVAPLAPGELPLLLVNAVKGTCAVQGASQGFPDAARARIDALLRSLAHRP